MATHDEDDGLCVLCYAQARVLRYRPCGHCVACERCAIRHVLAQLQAGELRPRCSHGCGAEIVDVLRVERADPPIFERDEGNASCQPGAHSLEAFLERAAQKVLRCSVAQDASQAWLRLREAAGARRQLAFFEAVEAGDTDTEPAEGCDYDEDVLVTMLDEHSFGAGGAAHHCRAPSPAPVPAVKLVYRGMSSESA